MFLDAAFNLKHNNGCAYTKFDFMTCDDMRLSRQLDAKQSVGGITKLLAIYQLDEEVLDALTVYDAAAYNYVPKPYEKPKPPEREERYEKPQNLHLHGEDYGWYYHNNLHKVQYMNKFDLDSEHVTNYRRYENLEYWNKYEARWCIVPGGDTPTLKVEAIPAEPEQNYEWTWDSDIMDWCLTPQPGSGLRQLHPEDDFLSTGKYWDGIKFDWVTPPPKPTHTPNDIVVEPIWPELHPLNLKKERNHLVEEETLEMPETRTSYVVKAA